MKDNIIIGKIFNVHGIKGELKVLPLTDDINRFKKLERCFIKGREYNAASARINKNHIILKHLYYFPQVFSHIYYKKYLYM